MTERELYLVNVLIARASWRQGDLAEVERNARMRASGERFSDNPELDKEIAELARRVRSVRLP